MRKIPFTRIELTSQGVNASESYMFTSELPGRQCRTLNALGDWRRAFRSTLVFVVSVFLSLFGLLGEMYICCLDGITAVTEV